MHGSTILYDHETGKIICNNFLRQGRAEAIYGKSGKKINVSISKLMTSHLKVDSKDINLLRKLYLRWQKLVSLMGQVSPNLVTYDPGRPYRGLAIITSINSKKLLTKAFFFFLIKKKAFLGYYFFIVVDNSVNGLDLIRHFWFLDFTGLTEAKLNLIEFSLASIDLMQFWFKNDDDPKKKHCFFLSFSFGLKLKKDWRVFHVNK